MNHIRSRVIVIVFLLIVLPGLGYYFLADSNEDITLFNITRNIDDDILNFDLNLDEQGSLVTSDPIHQYWVRDSKTNGGVIKELNGVQRKFAYGLKYLKKDQDAYMFQFVSYKKRNFYLRKDKTGTYRVYTKIGDKYVIVENIHLHVTKNGYSLLDLPKLSYVDINYLTNSSSAEQLSKRIYIKSK